MPVNSTHPDYDATLGSWIRARDVIAGEDAIKAVGQKYLPRLESQSEQEYAFYRARASFFNATARTAEGYLGLIFRRPPFLKLGDHAEDGGMKSALGKSLAVFANDADMLGTPLPGYARNVVSEVIAVGRCGTLVDWEDVAEHRVYASLYLAENILNWRVERINGRNLLTLVVLAEKANGQRTDDGGQTTDADEFEQEEAEQIRVLRLEPRVEGRESREEVSREYQCVVDLYQRDPKDRRKWLLVESRTPLRLGKPLPLIPFVFHGPRNFLPAVDKLPLADVISTNLDHYRLDADYKHGMHFTALPTAWVSGFDKESKLRIGSSTAWVTDTVGAAAGFLEYTGQGLTTFERAMDRDERLMAILGARLLEGQKRVGEAAEAIALRQSGENSILANLAGSVSASLTQVLRWCYWWNSIEELPDDVTQDQVVMELNTDFSTAGMSSSDLAAVVKAWQIGALSQDSMLDLFRRGEILPEGRTNEEEVELIKRSEVGGQGSDGEDLRRV